MNYASLVAEASSIIDIRAAMIAAGAAFMAGVIIVLIRHMKVNR